MERDNIAKCLILQYLQENQEKEEFKEEIKEVIQYLTNAWNIDIDLLKNVQGATLLDLIEKPMELVYTAQQKSYMGRSSLGLGNFDDAITFFTEAIELQPNDPKLYCERGCAYLKKGIYQNAIEDCQNALSYDKSLSQAYLQYGFALLAMNEVEAAKEIYQKGLEACPGNEALYESISSLSIYKRPNSGISTQIQQKYNTPEFQEMLKDPEMASLVQQLQKNPHEAFSLMGDPHLMKLMSVLIN